MQQKTLRLVCGLMILCSLLGVGLACFVASEGFMQAAAEQAAPMLSEKLGIRVDIGQVEIASLHKLRVREIAVYDKRSQLLGQAREADISFSLLGMLWQEPVEALREIQVDRAEVGIYQRSDGSWNYEDLISEEPGTGNFTGLIELQDAVLKTRYNNQDLVLEQVNGQIDMAHYPAVSLQGTCVNQGAKGQLSATIDSKHQTFHLKLEDAELADYAGLLTAEMIDPKQLREISGHLLQAEITGERLGDSLFYQGQLELEQGRAVVLDTNQVEDIKALCSFNDKEALLFVGAQCNGQQAAAHGKITMNQGAPLLDLTVTAQSFEPSAIIQDIPYQGPVNFTAHVTGLYNEPQVTAEVEIAQGQVADVSFQNLTSRLSYQNSMITVQQLQADTLGGHVEGTGSFQADSYDFLASLELQQLSAGELTGLSPQLPAVSGSISGQLTLQGNARDLENMAAYGSVSGNSLTCQGISFVAAEGSFFKKGQRVLLDYMSLHFANGGTLGLEGQLELGDTINMSFYGSEADMSQLQQLMPKVQVSGLLDIKGTVIGPIDNPIVRAEYAARDGSIFYQPFDRLHGRAAGSLRGMKIDDFVMEHGDKTKWLINNGMIGFLGDKGINIRVDTVKARMEDLIKAYNPDIKLTGNVDNVITITGTLKDPHIEGYVDFSQGSYNGMFLNRMQGDYELDEGVLKVIDFHIFTPWIDMDLNGTMDADGTLAMDVKGHEIDLKRYNTQLPLPLEGRARFGGRITGTRDNPVFHGDMEADTIMVNGLQITDAKGEAAYYDHHVYLTQFSFTQEQGAVVCNGNVDINTGELQGKLDLINGDIHNFMSMLNLGYSRLGGQLTGDMSFSGTVDNPRVTIAGMIENGNVGAYQLYDTTLDAVIYKDRVVLNDFSGREGTAGSFSVTGTANSHGPLDLQVSLHAIDMGAVADGLGLNRELSFSGLLDSSFQVKGTWDNPVADVPLLIDRLALNGASLDSVTGTFHLANQVVKVDQLTASKLIGTQTYQLVIDGKAPLAAFTDVVSTEDNQFDLDIDLGKADLSLLPLMSRYIDWAVGATNGHIKLQGTMKRPYVTGSVVLQEGAFKLKNMRNPFTDMNIRLLFTGDTATLERCEAQMGGGSISARGFAHVDGLQLDDYNFDLQLDKLGVDCPFFKGPITAELNVSDVTLTDMVHGTTIMPQLTGFLRLENDIISLPDLPDDSSAMPLAALDYTLEIGKNVRFISSMLGNLQLAGGAHFGGTTYEPNTSGSIYVKKGNINYLKTNFKVYQGEAQFGQPGSLLPKVILRAGTNIGRYQVFLSADGPLSRRLKLRLLSSPHLSEGDIIQLLTFRSGFYNKDAGNTGLVSAMDIGLQMTLLSEVETAMRNTLDLDLFTVERDTIEGSKKTGDKRDYEVYNVVLGKNITDNMLIKYGKSMTSSDYYYGLEYELIDNVSFTYKRDQDNKYTTMLEARFTF